MRVLWITARHCSNAVRMSGGFIRSPWLVHASNDAWPRPRSAAASVTAGRRAWQPAGPR